MPNEHAQKKRLWIVTEVYYPEMISTGYYLTSIAEGLTADFDVKVICGQPNYAARGTIAPYREVHNGVEIFRTWSTRLDKNVIPYRVVNMFTLGASMFMRSIARFGPGDEVLVVTAPPSLPFTTALAALMRRSTYTLLLHDSYPEILVAVGKTKPDSALVRVANRLNRWLYKHARRIIVVGRDMKELMEQKARGLDPAIVTIPNWADLDLVEPGDRHNNPLLEQLGLRDKFVFMYAGNIGHPTDIESIIECASMLRDDERFHFVFVGSGAKKPWLDATVAERGLTNVSILGTRPREEQRVFLNACDVGLISLVGNMWGTAMPSRTYNILAAGKPILALTDEGSELARVIDEERVGWHIRPHDPAALRDAVIEIYSRRAELDEMGRRARAAAVEKYSPERAVESYRRAMTSFTDIV
ncbi:MAG: glycosyltransferase family 4 protein [Pyrinomonadaceae bacterium]